MDIMTELRSGLTKFNFNFLNIVGDVELLILRSSLFRSIMIEEKGGPLSKTNFIQRIVLRIIGIYICDTFFK